MCSAVRRGEAARLNVTMGKRLEMEASCGLILDPPAQLVT